MRRDWSDASRRDDVLDAATGWRAAGAIDDTTLSAIVAEYSGRRPSLAAGWRVLVFVLVSVAVNALFGGVFLFSGERGADAACVVYGVILGAATETLRSSRMAGTGADAAASFWAAGYLVGGVVLILAGRANVGGALAVTVCLLLAAIVFAAACVRWGYDAYGALAAAALFLLLARFLHGRLLWIAAAAVLLPVAERQRSRAALPPPHRRAFAWVVAVSAVALYTAVNRYSLDEHLVEALRDGSRPGAPAPLTQILASLATALLPLAFVGVGLRRRRVLLLDLGVVAAALSLVTLRHYMHLAPLWFLLLLCGAGLLLGALGLNRFLRRAPQAERGGFTASPLFESKAGSGIEAVAVVAGFAPGAAAAAGRDEFTPGGGRFGGGGASGSF